MNNPIVQHGLKYGLIGGAIVIIYSLITILIGLSPSNMMIMGLSSMVVVFGAYILIVVLSQKAVRRDLKKLSLGDAMGTGVIAVVVTGLLGAIFSFIYNNFIDPEYLASMVDMMTEYFEEMGMTEEMIEAQISNVESQGSIGGVLKNSLMGIVTGTIISLISGLILKKDADALTLD